VKVWHVSAGAVGALITSTAGQLQFKRETDLLTILGVGSFDGLCNQQPSSLRSSICNDTTVGSKERGEDLGNDRFAFAVETVSEQITGTITSVCVREDLGSPE